MLFPDLQDLLSLRPRGLMRTNIIRAQTSNKTSGDYASLFHGLGLEFETSRLYVVGDDVRHIDWRLSARLGKTHVKTFRAECDRNVILLIDVNKHMRFATRGTFKSVQAAKLAAVLAWHSLQQQDRVGALVFGDIKNGIQYFPPAKSEQNVLRLLKTLSDKNINQHTAVNLDLALDHLQKVAPTQSLIFVISDFSNYAMQDLEKSLLGLKSKNSLVLIPINDPADKDLSDVGNLIFSDGENSTFANTSNKKALKQYRDIWDKYLASMDSLARRLRSKIYWVSTTIDPRLILRWKT